MIEAETVKKCRPDSIADIRGLVDQGGRGRPFNLFIYCRQGQGALKKIKVQMVAWNRGDGVMRAIEGAKKGFSLISFVDHLEGESVIMVFPDETP
jgi:hypothetical protein